MQIWKLKVAEGDYHSLQLVDNSRESRKFLEQSMKQDSLVSNHFSGVIDLSVLDGTIATDMPQIWNVLTGMVVFSENAVKLLTKYLQEIELIKMRRQDQYYYAVHFTKHEDVLDYNDSELQVLESGLVIGIDKYSFIQEHVENKHLFKIILNGKNYYPDTFVSDEFKEYVESLDIKGMLFEKAWDSNKF